MNGDIEKEKKEVKYSGDENSQTSIDKPEDEKAVEHDTKKEALDILENMPPEIKKNFYLFQWEVSPGLYYHLLNPK